jgi:hypothetical protein
MIFELFECLGLTYFLEILYEIVLAELFKFICTESIRINQQIAHIIVIHIVH